MKETKARELKLNLNGIYFLYQKMKMGPNTSNLYKTTGKYITGITKNQIYTLGLAIPENRTYFTISYVIGIK